MKKFIAVSIGFALLAIPAHAQYGKKFTASAFAPPTVNGARYYNSGQLFALMNTTPANEEAYVFVNSATGARQAAFRLDSNHGVLISPDGSELLITGNRTISNQPVYFAGRYDPTNLQPIAQMQMNVNSTSGYTLVSEVSPEGAFLFGGSHTTLGANLVAKYGTNFSPQWGTMLKYQGAFANTGTEFYPLPNGDVGFRLVFQGFDLGTGAIVQTNVLGLLGGANGELKWAASVIGSQTATLTDDIRFVFAPDGSMLVAREKVNLGGPPTNAVSLVRVAPNGTLAYSKTLAVPGLVYEASYYMAGHAFAYFTSPPSDPRRVQFIALDENGNLSANTALNCALGSRGLTAARREGTDIAFIRIQCDFADIAPEQTLIRFNLTNGVMEFRRLPFPGLGVELYDLVTTPSDDGLSGDYSRAGFAAVTTAIYGDIDQTSGGSVGFYELPCDGSFPSCLPLTAASVSAGTPLAAQLTDLTLVTLGGVSAAPHTMPGMIAATALPTLQTLTFNENTVCPDDGVDCSGSTGGGDRPVLMIVPAAPGQATISWTSSTPGFILRESAALAPPNWTNSPSGTNNPATVPTANSPKFYQLYKP